MDKNVTILVDFDHTLFNTTKYVDYLSGSPKTINYENFLYPDALEFISYASSFGKLVLFSEGDADFQKEKINATGIGKFFSGGIKIFPPNSKILELTSAKVDTKKILIDDKPEVVDKAISMGYRTIRVRRGKYADVGTTNNPNFVVPSLSEIVEKDILRIM